MYEQFLQQIGLSKEQALVYNALILRGLLPARLIIQKVGLKRGLVYKILDQLIEMGLIEKRDNIAKISLFCVTHPSSLNTIIEKRSQEIINARTSLDSITNKLVSDYNLMSGKPNVQFFEGVEGMKKVLEDSLSAQTEIYSYADIEAIQKYIPDINADYVKKRDKFNIKKKAILLDTPFARSFLKDYFTGVTDIRLIKTPTTPFQTVMQIYDNKVSYITLSDKEMIGVIIEDKHIYAMHRDLFEYTWGTAVKIGGEEGKKENLTDLLPVIV
jgi:HTH-type transcriptional regulator, sugar sensing transcriptional regulator